jgi:hypothetical protein
VSSAVYGGQVYKKFGEEVIKGLMSEEPEDGHDQGEKVSFPLLDSYGVEQYKCLISFGGATATLHLDTIRCMDKPCRAINSTA